MYLLLIKQGLFNVTEIMLSQFYGTKSNMPFESYPETLPSGKSKHRAGM